MLRASGLALALVSFALAGCGGDSEKELPKNIGAPTDRGSEPAAPAIPKTSDPDAAAFVQARLAAATEGHPERLEKLKTNRLAESGRMLIESIYVPATRNIAAVWPDRFLYSNETNSNGVLKLSIGLRQGVLSFRRNGEAADPRGFFPKSYEEVLHVDSIGQHWMLTLVPLADSQTIFFNVKKQAVTGQTWDTVQAAVPKCPPFTLWFDEKTKLLGGVSYVHSEGESRVNKVLLASGHKPFSGVQLPTKLSFSRGGIEVENWVISSWEFPDRIEDSVFDQK